MDVVGHQTPSQDAKFIAEAAFAQKLKIMEAVLVGEEDVLAVIAALSYMMGHVGQDKAGSPRHEG